MPNTPAEICEGATVYTIGNAQSQGENWQERKEIESGRKRERGRERRGEREGEKMRERIINKERDR